MEEGEGHSAVNPFMSMDQFYSTLLMSAHVPDVPAPPLTPYVSYVPLEMFEIHDQDGTHEIANVGATTWFDSVNDAESGVNLDSEWVDNKCRQMADM